MADKAGYEWGTGRRKTAIARVRLRPGNGKILINGRDYRQYFPVHRLQMTVEAPLRKLEIMEKYDIYANIRGGGITGQAGAFMMGLGRALVKAEPSQRPELKLHGFLSRDARMVERKKPGKPGARKSFQFSKR